LVTGSYGREIKEGTEQTLYSREVAEMVGKKYKNLLKISEDT